MPIAAAFCASSWKWPAVFYCGALISVIWVIVFKFTTSDTPQQAKCIKAAERAYLEGVLGSYKPKKVCIL